MSIKTRVFAAVVAASLVAGTASFALAEPRQSRRTAIEEGQGFVGQLFEWVRERLAGRRDAGDRATTAEPGTPQKDICGADPNGSPIGCHK